MTHPPRLEKLSLSQDLQVPQLRGILLQDNSLANHHQQRILLTHLLLVVGVSGGVLRVAFLLVFS